MTLVVTGEGRRPLERRQRLTHHAPELDTPADYKSIKIIFRWFSD